MMTSTGRQEQDFRYLANKIKYCGINRIICGADRELALKMGLESIYPIECVSPMKTNNNIKLRCINHVKDDMLAAQVPRTRKSDYHRHSWA